MTPLLLALLLQASPFDRYVEQARVKLGIAQVPVTRSTDKPSAAWVQYGPGAGWMIFVRPDFLRQAPPQTQRVIAIHECCHLYIGNTRIPRHERDHDLVHAMIDGCVEWVLGPDTHSVLHYMPCNDWYPFEAIRYNRRIGKERCIEKRLSDR